MPSDWTARDSGGTSKKLQSGVELAAGRSHYDIAAVLERTRVDDRGRPNRIDAGRFMDMPGDAQVGLELLDKTARCCASDCAPAGDPITASLERRRMANHQQRTKIANLAIAAHERLVDLVLGEFGRGLERRDIGSAAAEDGDAVNHRSAPVQSHSLVLKHDARRR